MTLSLCGPHRIRSTGTLAGIGLWAALSGLAPAHAQSGVLDDLVYYRIGGGQAVRAPAGYGRHARIRGDASLSLGYSCGAFDLEDNLQRMFGQFTSGLDRAVDSLLFAATGAVSSLPLYLLRQANPNLASMLENTMLRYEEEYRLAVKSCREAEREILAGENPYYDWVRFGQRDTWRKSAGSAATAPEVEATVAEQHGCVTWIDGEYFCDDRDARTIRVVEDVAREGYRRIRAIEDGGPDGAADSRLQAVWPDADAAIREILDLTGETVITNARTTPPEGQPPRGIHAAMQADAVDTAERLQAAIGDTLAGQFPSVEERAALGVPGLAITPALLWSIGTLEADLRQAAIDRIATEIALLRAMEKIHLARRVLLTGARIPAVEASPARAVIRENAIRLLETEAHLLKDEYDLRTRAAASTAAGILQASLARRQQLPSTGGGGIPAGSPIGSGVLR